MKLIKLTGVALMCATVFASCENNDGPELPVINEGNVYVICNGALNNQIPGSITSYDPETKAATLSAFAKANGRTIGSSVESATGANGIIYFVCTQEHRIELADQFTLASKGSIDMLKLFGQKGTSPRFAAYYYGRLYITTYSGYVCVVNATTLQAITTYEVGPYPEELSIVPSSTNPNEAKIWVANSDYGRGMNASISCINLSTGIVETITDPAIKNPYQILASEDFVWIIDRGSYDASWNQVGAGLYCYTIVSKQMQKLADATMMSGATNEEVVVCNNPWNNVPVTPTYAKVNLYTGMQTALPNVKVEYPSFVAYNPLDGNIYVGSNKTDPDTGYADFSGNGYVGVFNTDGNPLSTFDCGVNPMNIIFTYSME